MRRLSLSFLLALVIIAVTAAPVLAYLYRAPYTIAETGGTAHTGLSVSANLSTSWLITNGFITNSTALDTRVETLGGAEQIHMVAGDRVLAFLPSLEANSQINWYLTTGNTPLTGFPVITGHGGNVTVTDHANLELANHFSIEFEGWMLTSAAAPLVYKQAAFSVNTTAGNIVADILGATPKTVSVPLSTGEYTVNVWADGTNFGIDIDGVTQNTTALTGASVPDNANNWVISNLPYFNYYKHTVTDDFPEVVARSSGEQTSDTASHPITLPTGIQSGDLLLCIFSSDGGITVAIDSGVGWTILDQYWTVSYHTPTTAILYKVATGSDGLTLSTSANQQSSHIVLRIENGGTPTTARNTASGSNSNPPAHTAGRAGNNLWVASVSWNGIINPSAAPSGYSNLTKKVATNASGASTATAERLLFALTEDPGAFTSAAEYHHAYTTVVPPINQVADTLRIQYEPTSYILGTVLPNSLSPGTYNGAITWGTNPAGVTATVGSLISATQPSAGTDSGGDVHRDVIYETPVSDWFAEPDIGVRLAANPLRPLVTIMSDTTSLTEIQAWRFLGLALLLLIVVASAAAVRGHLLIAGLAGAGTIGLIVHLTIWPMWSLVFAIPAVIAGIMAERTPSV